MDEPFFSYVPCLMAKAGELKGLQLLREGDRRVTTPLIDVPDLPVKKKGPPVTVAEHLDGLGKSLLSSWGIGKPIFVDLGRIPAGARLDNGSHPVTSVFTHCPAFLHSVPVTALGRDRAYQRAVADVVRERGRGVCVRLAADDLGSENLEQALEKLSMTVTGKELERAAGEVDLIVDLGEVSSKHGRLLATTLPALLREIPHLEDWRSFTLLSGAFPASLSSVEHDTVGSFKRADWTLWNAILNSGLPRVPGFGDYAIQYPDPEPMDMSVVRPSATIRYTADEEWLIFRGRSVRRGYDQFHDLSAKVVKHPSFTGRLFSAGDQFIGECARRTGKTGNLTTWVAMGTNHHMTFVVRDLARVLSNLRVP